METPLLPGLSVKLRVGYGYRKNRRVVVLPGVNVNRDLVVHNNSLKNVVRSIAERVLYCKDDQGVYQETPKPIVGAFDRLRSFRSSLLRQLPPTTHIALDEYPSLLVGRKRLVAQKAVDSLRREPLTVKDSHLSFFVKCEKVDQTTKGDSAPRGINPRDPRYSVSLGRYLKLSEKALYKGIENVFGSVTVAKGLNMLERGELINNKWNRFRDPVAVGLDAKRFDQHVSVPALRFEHSVYNSWHREPELAKLLKMQLVNRGVYNSDEGRVEFTVQGCRMSGDMNTSSGNCLLMCGMVHAYTSEKHLTMELINDGDDCVVFMEKRDLGKFMGGLREWFLEMGFNMKVEEPVYEIEKVEFCQAHPINIGDDTYIMVRDPIMSMSKDSLILTPNLTHTDGLRAWMWSVGDACSATCGGIPVLGSFYEMYRRGGTRVEKLESGFDMWWYRAGSKGLAHRRGAPVLPITRYSYYIAFGQTPDEQIVLEEHYNKMLLPAGQPQRPSVDNLTFSKLDQDYTTLLQNAADQKATC